MCLAPTGVFGKGGAVVGWLDADVEGVLVVWLLQQKPGRGDVVCLVGWPKLHWPGSIDGWCALISR